jgi:hypothetical protein
MNKSNTAEALSALRRAVAPLPARLEMADEEGRESRVRLHVGSHTYRLVLVWAGQGFPRDVQAAVEVAPALGASEVLVVTARRISEGAMRWLRERDIAWADLAGAANIVAPPGLAVVRGAHPSDASAAATTQRWTSSGAVVAEWILATASSLDRIGDERYVLPPVAALSAGVGWSPAQVSNVLRSFDRESWTRKEGASRGPSARRVLCDPTGLLSAWASWHADRTIESRKAHAVWRDPYEIVAQLGNRLPVKTWCVSGWLAAAELAPFATTIPSMVCYLDGSLYDAGLDGLLADEGLREVEEGARIEFVRAEDHLLALRREGPIPLAPPVRVYADLLRVGGRGAQAAEHLREVRIGF